jgi:diguanylate cyclase (GGDEF)-like protein
MSIRSIILAGCLALTGLTGLLGLYAEVSETRLGTVALNIYDNAFMAMNYLRAAQIEFAGMTARPPGDPNAEALADVLGDLDIADERAMSDGGRLQIKQLRAAIQIALANPASNLQRTALIQRAFERAVETFADDGFRYRRQVALHLAAQSRQTRWAIAAILLATLLITALIARLIVPPVRRAVRVAQSIADGKLDNVIPTGGRGETADLLRALSAMQASIAAAMARINALMEVQAATHADEKAAQNARMAAALDNMNQGLCLFDAQGCLAVANRRFGEMFGKPRLGAPADEVQRAAGLGSLPSIIGGADASTLACGLPNGRTIAISQAAVAGGGWVATYEDITERQAAQARLSHMARHDVLTGLPNRLMFGEYTNAVLAEAVDSRSVALLCLDIHRFRAINETMGHAVGDGLLRAVAQRLQACLRGRADRVFRLDGDEFAVLQQGNQPTDARLLAQRLCELIAEPFTIGQQRIEIGVSLGISLAGDVATAECEALLKCAELALDRAKREGVGKTCFFEPDMDREMRARRKLEIDLRAALDRNQLVAFYQPQLAVVGGVCGFEALLRWQHPTRGLISPAEFIPVAEEIGLIGALGHWVLMTACREAALWPADVRVGVNLSPAQFRNRSVLLDVQAALEQSGLPPDRLELEITEAVLLDDDEHVLQTLRTVRALGVRVTMDDFGIGYSSLGYLTRFPFDKIKIDQSFVREMTIRPNSLAVIRAVIGLGRSLGMSVIAEGVETAEQHAMLADEGVDALQGYLFGRPQPAFAVAGTLRQYGVAGLHAVAL